ncbi:MAG: murein biosynthesis integral membrane protein MurJ [Gammaproteobacteria bacterium]
MNILRAFLSVGIWTFISRILGLARDVVVASIFGAGALMDAFFAAFRLPNTLRRFTAEGALTQAFVPAYAAARRENEENAAAFAGELLFVVATFLTILSAAVALFAPQIMRVFAPGLAESDAAAAMLRVVFPYIALISVVALLAGMLNAGRHFRAAAAAPVLLNLCMIAAAFLSSSAHSPPNIALAWGVLAGGIAQLLWAAFFVRRAGLRLRIRPRRPDARMKSALIRMGQSALGAGATQINLLINLGVASLLPAGAISWLYYADRLMELPAGILGAALATVALPALSDDSENAHAVLDKTLRLAAILSAPAAVGMALLAEPIVAVLFMRGAFDATDAEMTARAVVAYSLGVVGFVALRPLAAAFFARRDAATPAKIAVCALILTQMCNGVFVFLLEWNHAGIALSVGIAATFNAAALLWILRRRVWYAPMAGWRKLCAALAAALAAMSVALLAARPAAEFWYSAALFPRVAALGGLVVLGAGVYFAILRIGGVRLSDFQDRP